MDPVLLLKCIETERKPEELFESTLMSQEINDCIKGINLELESLKQKKGCISIKDDDYTKLEHIKKQEVVMRNSKPNKRRKMQAQINNLKKEMAEGESPNARNIISGTLAKSVLGQIGINVDIDQFITRQTGAAINPNLELLFGGPQLRTFSFAFDFAPNSDKEAHEVRRIQRWFKQGMLPSRSGVKGARSSSLFLGSPNVFRIAYMNKSRRIKGLNIIKICALTSCQIDFTPDNTYQSYEDTSAFSQPVRSTMALTFNELTPVFRDDYGDDENSDFARDPSLEDLDTNITGDNSISDTDIGF